jgi:RNA polymerase sigma factor (sigma-70 family)
VWAYLCLSYRRDGTQTARKYGQLTRKHQGGRITVCKHLHSIVIEKHGTKRTHHKQTNGKGKDLFGKRWCDVPKCQLVDRDIVARAISREFTVSTKKCQMTSQIIMAEVKVSDYESEADAIEAVRKLALEPERPLTLEMLHQIKRPLEHGYTRDEIIVAMHPYIMKHALSYKTNHFPLEDAMQMGAIGVDAALDTDRALAPLSNHAFRHIQTKIRREACSSGLIKHGERDGDFHGRLGTQIGTEIDENGNTKPVYNSIQSADAELTADGFTLCELMADDYETSNPQELAIRSEEIAIAKVDVAKLINGAGLSEQQKKVFCMSWGLNDHIDSPYDEDTTEFSLWENGNFRHTGTEIAKIIGCSRQRVGQQLEKCEQKILRSHIKIEKLKAVVK